jgi:hypothetical protein
MKTTYFNLVDDRPTLWDAPAPDRTALVLVKLNGRPALLHPDTLKSLKGYVEYATPDEERNWQENENEWPTDAVHAYHLLTDITPDA